MKFEIYIEPKKKLYLGTIEAKDKDEALDRFYDMNPNLSDYLDDELTLEVDYADIQEKEQRLYEEHIEFLIDQERERKYDDTNN